MGYECLWRLVVVLSGCGSFLWFVAMEFCRWMFYTILMGVYIILMDNVLKKLMNVGYTIKWADKINKIGF